MSHVPSQTDVIALEASAGLALACAYSGSDEYEAEVIQARRNAGAYGSKWHREIVWACAGVAALTLIIFAI
jgi:hypothetical protein